MSTSLFRHAHADKGILILIWLLSIVLIAFSKEQPHLHPGELAYSISRGILAIIVLYYLLPQYFQKGRYIVFAGLLLVSFFIFGSFEEGILEPTFFPDTRGIEKWTFFGVYIFTLQSLPLIGFMLFFKLAWEYRDTQDRLAALQNEKTESQLSFLRSQINPHILFNALNNIYSYSVTDVEKTPEMLVKLSDLLRYTLYECSSERVSLEQELNALHNYIRLQELGLEDRGTVTCEITGDRRGKYILPYVLITLVENCFKHSLDTQHTGIVIAIRIHMEDTAIRLVTRNSFNKDGRGDNEGIKEKGLGLSNVRQRLELLCGSSFSLDQTTDTDNMYSVSLTMPLFQSPE